MISIWVDADSAAPALRELVARRAEAESGRRGTGSLRAVFVSNRGLELPRSTAEGGKGAIVSIVVGAGPGVADDLIIEAAAKGDIVITRDLGLAQRAVESGLRALNDRGVEWDLGSVRERRSAASHMTALRELGGADALPKGRAWGPREKKAFADSLDRAVTKALRD